MRKLAIGAAAFAALIGAPAFAADVVVKAPPPAPAPAYSWTGFYIGANIGAGWMQGQPYTFADPGNAAFSSCGMCTMPYSTEALSGGTRSGVLGGGQVGYNWQVTPTWLVGVEGDFTGADLKQSVNAPLFSDAGTTFAIIPVVGSNLHFATDNKWLASARVRVGYLVQNTWLIYATGGPAWGNFGLTANAACPPTAQANGCVFTSGTQAPFSLNVTRTGFAAGGGVEWEFASQWRARAEYLFYGFDSTNSASSLFVALPGGGPLTCIVTPTCSANYTFGRENIQTVRIGLSYAFR